MIWTHLNRLSARACRPRRFYLRFITRSRDRGHLSQVQIWIRAKLRRLCYRHVIIDRFSAKWLQRNGGNLLRRLLLDVFTAAFSKSPIIFKLHSLNDDFKEYLEIRKHSSNIVANLAFFKAMLYILMRLYFYRIEKRSTYMLKIFDSCNIYKTLM